MYSDTFESAEAAVPQNDWDTEGNTPHARSTRRHDRAISAKLDLTLIQKERGRAFQLGLSAVVGASDASGREARIVTDSTCDCRKSKVARIDTDYHVLSHPVAS